MGVILVTGAGAGIGRCTAFEAAQRGHIVYAGVRRAESAPDLEAAAGSLAEGAGSRIRVLALDVTVAEQRDAAVERILADEGRIDGLVNNAGRTLGGFLEDLDEDEVRALFEVNVFAVWALTQRCLPTMRAQQSGTIVMMSSMSGRMALPALGAYASSKFALEGLSEAWRHELAPLGIRVVLVEPGPFATDIFGRNRTLGRRAKAEDSPYAARRDVIAEQVDRSIPRIAGDPDDVARKVCDLIAHPAPGLRHLMGRNTLPRDILSRVAPFWLVERIVARLSGG